MQKTNMLILEIYASESIKSRSQKIEWQLWTWQGPWPIWLLKKIKIKTDISSVLIL